MVRFSGGQQGEELLPDGLDDVWWQGGHGACSFCSGSLEDSPNDRASVSAFCVGALRAYWRSLLVARPMYPSSSLAPRRTVSFVHLLLLTANPKAPASPHHLLPMSTISPSHRGAIELAVSYISCDAREITHWNRIRQQRGEYALLSQDPIFPSPRESDTNVQAMFTYTRSLRSAQHPWRGGASGIRVASSNVSPSNLAGCRTLLGCRTESSVESMTRVSGS